MNLSASPIAPLRRRRRLTAFTLIELLVVLGVIAIFFAMAAPQITGILGSNRITSAGEFVYNKLTQAQQMAITDSREVQVRLFTYRDPATPGSKEQFRGIQFVGWKDDGTIENLTDVLTLDSGVVISDNEELSSIVAKLELSEETVKVPKVDEPAPYISFVFRPDGSTSLPAIASGNPANVLDNNWYLTIVDEIDEEKQLVPPKNFYCVQIDPDSGRLTAYRP